MKNTVGDLCNDLFDVVLTHIFNQRGSKFFILFENVSMAFDDILMSFNDFSMVYLFDDKNSGVSMEF